MSSELEERFLRFTIRTRNFCAQLKYDSINRSYISQLVRSSASVGANYIEASDSLGQADGLMKLKISRREAKESAYWLALMLTYDQPDLEAERNYLLDGSRQITRILSAIILKLA